MLASSSTARRPRPADEGFEFVIQIWDRRGVASDHGSGLGLAIVKAIAERHAANATRRDTAGGGLTVRVTFPPRSTRPQAGPIGSGEP